MNEFDIVLEKAELKLFIQSFFLFRTPTGIKITYTYALSTQSGKRLKPNRRHDLSMSIVRECISTKLIYIASFRFKSSPRPNRLARERDILKQLLACFSSKGPAQEICIGDSVPENTDVASVERQLPKKTIWVQHTLLPCFETLSMPIWQLGAVLIKTRC